MIFIDYGTTTLKFSNGATSESAIFNDGKYGESAQTIEEAELIEIPISVLRDQIAANPQFAMNMMTAMSLSSRRQSMEIEHLTLQNAPQRIGCFLLRLCNLPTRKPV